MARIVVVGSGASGVHFAWAALQRGHDIAMIDVGTPAPHTVLPEAPFEQLKSQLPDAAKYFLGERFQAALLPGDAREYYGLPPSKDYVFVTPDAAGSIRSTGFAPLFSFARGGLAQAWTAGCYPFNDAELEAFPWGYEELAPHYDAVAQEIGINGAADDLARFFPVHQHLLPGLPLDEHAERLWQRYERRRERLNRMGAYLGRSRAATLPHERDDRPACWQCGRCLWGCPTESLYTPAITLRRCVAHDHFEYHGGLLAEYLRLGHDDRAEAILARHAATGELVEIGTDHVVLAAGTLSSARIFLETLRRNRQEVVRLAGLMDNRQILMPFLTLAMMGRPVRTDRYQYHQLMMALDHGTPAELVHCQITTLKSAAIHPIVQAIPLGLRSALTSFREIRAALGIANVNLPDHRRPDNYVTLAPSDDDNRTPPLAIHYAPPTVEAKSLPGILRQIRRCLWKLGAVAPPPMTHIRPMGASVHYAGTLPMSTAGGSLTTTPNGRSRDIPNLHLVDGSTFCFLPAKNLTFTLMANARRIAHAEF